MFKEWAKVRADYFKQEKERLYLEDPIFMKANEVNESDIKQCFELGRKCDHAQLANLPLQDFYKAAKILEYSQRCGKEEMFFDSFKVVLERGHVREWAQHIIDYHTVKAIGGDTYREVAV